MTARLRVAPAAMAHGAHPAGSPRAPVRVLLVDDSAVVRQVLSGMLSRAGLEVIGAAHDPLQARTLLRREWPDVIVLDVEMPHMDGITFLRELMASRPTPVVMCSTLTEKGAQTTLAAMAAGAVGFVTKPRLGLRGCQLDDGLGLVAAVRAAARTNLRALARVPPPLNRLPPLPALATATAPALSRLVVAGLSTGGVQAIEQVLPRLPADAPGLVIVQHMPAQFTASLASRLDALCAIQVREARHGDRVLPGLALFAPGGRHTRLARSGSHIIVEVFDAPAVNHHRPSVDVLLRSAADVAGPMAVGVVMTGMGDDGARGLRAMRDAGAWTLAQDEASSVVFGMPREAIRLGGACEVVPLSQLADRLLAAARAPA